MMNGSGYGKNNKEGDRDSGDREDHHLSGKVQAEQSRLRNLCGSSSSDDGRRCDPSIKVTCRPD